ncbi:hypothetical protein L6R52_19220 [Myxococcota bacterium]|nr:hypothetical protein [Myxococcota bacterium]
MIPFLLLATLAIVDAGFSGFRDAAGRNPRIRKQGYFRRAVRRGLKLGFVGCGVVGLVAALLVARAHSPSEALAALSVTAEVMVWSFGTYATLVLIALGLWLAAEPDLRTLASVVVLGPFTLIRPWWIVATCAWAAATAPQLEATITALVAALAQLTIEPWLAREWRSGTPAALTEPSRRR